jgi:RNA polymerase sigma-70 factor (ECF subfamily)
MSDDIKKKSEKLEQFREYLTLLARLQLDAQLQAKVDLSGVIQQTMLEAHRCGNSMLGQDDDGLARWLRQILTNNLVDEVRRFRTQTRDVGRERPLETELEASSARIEGWLAAEQSSPSQRAIRNEELLQLAEVLTCLPEDQRKAVELHHLKGLVLNDIAEEMDRTKGAVAALLFRGLRKLRELLEVEDRE